MVQPPYDQDFLNPYVLVPAPLRDPDDPVWGDHPGPGHDVLLPDHYSGTIPITVTARSPLLLLDHGAAGEGQPVPVREREVHTKDGVDKRPVLEASSLHGVLRSYFEALTNSRFSVFSRAHSDLIAIRQPAGGALDMYVGQVSDINKADGSGEVTVNLWLEPTSYPTLPGNTYPRGREDLAPSTPTHPAVWVPLELLENRVHRTDVRTLHGVPVRARVYLLVHHAVGDQQAFWYWRASAIAFDGEELEDPLPHVGRTSSLPDHTPRLTLSGLLLVGGKSISLKHDERLFVTSIDKSGGDAAVEFQSPPLAFDAETAKRWTAVYDSYAKARGLTERQQAGQPAYSAGVGLSRHNTDDGHKSERILKKGQLLFARFPCDLYETNTVDGLFPVMIGRETFPLSPGQVLDELHHPAPSADKLSPADRLFGWARTEAGVKDRERGVDAYAGHFRVDPVRCEAKNAIYKGGNPLWLPILNSPKPEQFRFRLLGEDDKPLPRGAKKSEKTPADGYAANRRLGRSLFRPHKGLPKGYWRWPAQPTPTEDARETGYDPQGLTPEPVRYREFLAPPGTRKKVASQISGWVLPQTKFTTTLRVENVEPTLLGVLLWMLQRNDDFSYMLGSGNPFGFGEVSIKTDLEKVRVSTGEQRRAAFSSWNGPANYASDEQLKVLITTADEKLPDVCKVAVCAIATGDARLPVHYPRTTAQPAVESFRWFAANDRKGGFHISNPEPTAEHAALPLTPGTPRPPA